MTPHDLARMYLEKGKEDEIAAAKLAEDPSISNPIIGFHLQQAVEKYLKALLAAQEARPSRTHNLADLLGQLRELGIEIPEDFDAAVDLAPYAVHARYPFVTSEILSIDRPAMLSLVGRIRVWTEEQLD